MPWDAPTRVSSCLYSLQSSRSNTTPLPVFCSVFPVDSAGKICLWGILKNTWNCVLFSRSLAPHLFTCFGIWATLQKAVSILFSSLYWATAEIPTFCTANTNPCGFMCAYMYMFFQASPLIGIWFISNSFLFALAAGRFPRGGITDAGPQHCQLGSSWLWNYYTSWRVDSLSSAPLLPLCLPQRRGKGTRGTLAKKRRASSLKHVF